MNKSLLLATSLLLTYNPTFAGGVDDLAELDALIAQFGDARVSSRTAAQDVPAVNDAFSRAQDGINQIHNLNTAADLIKEEKNDENSRQVARALVLESFDLRRAEAIALLDLEPEVAQFLLTQIDEEEAQYLAQNPQTVISEPKVNNASTTVNATAATTTTSSYVNDNGVRAPIAGQKNYRLMGDRISDLFTVDNVPAYYMDPAQELNNLMGRIKSHSEYAYDGEEALKVFAQTIIDPVLEQYENAFIQFTADQDEELIRAISLSMAENNKVEEPKESKVETSVVNQEDTANMAENNKVEEPKIPAAAVAEEEEDVNQKRLARFASSAASTSNNSNVTPSAQSDTRTAAQVKKEIEKLESRLNNLRRAHNFAHAKLVSAEITKLETEYRALLNKRS